MKDILRVVGGVSSTPTHQGIRMSDGSPVPVEVIMEQFGVSREEAEKIARRPSR